MTVRMTVALAVLTLGLAVAALAGIPALIENRAVGDVVVIVGLAVALVGLLLLTLAIPGQRTENHKLKRSAAAEVDQLRVEHNRLLAVRRQTLETLKEEQSSLNLMMSSVINVTGEKSAARAEIKRLEASLVELDALQAANRNEFRRYGMEPPPISA